ncbi:hypothetical protein GF325_19305 [Candidatus Bathyarchaeota archaeon]|nr:hypothetical protein [Candidatus Bathyarchaeota archaeon]
MIDNEISERPVDAFPRNILADREQAPVLARNVASLFKNPPFNQSMSEGITYRIVISKNERSMQIAVEPDVFIKAFVNKRINDEVDGALIGYPGYLFEIRGGSDIAGFPMRRDVHGGVKKRILATRPGVGVRNQSIRHGDKLRKMVRGNTITDQIVQVNCIVKKEGKVQLFVEPDEDEVSAE